MPANRTPQYIVNKYISHNSYMFVRGESLGAGSLVERGKEPAATSTPTTPTSSAEARSILASQRLKRPVSPHLSIYQPQLTWYMSATNRITGAILSGGLYSFALLYLISPYLGFHLESATLAASFAALPVAAKVGIKAFIAAPFTFHSLNGIRHLVWDTGRQLHLKGVYRTGYAVLGLTAVSTAALALM
ncbi:cytochrome b556 subunit of succinate dehydrogenase [Kalaharituber pfeilii]|nr:cytochrome b556 subunit of succinate dehydrogenase [Kalaharituber pfeilii]